MKKSAYLFVLSLILTASIMFSCGGGGGGSDEENTAFTISYDANGAESGTVPASQSGSEDKSASIQDNTGNLAKAGYLFDGWNSAADGNGKTYTPGTKYTGKDLKLYANWAAIYKVQDLGGSPAPALNGVLKASGSSNLKILGLTEAGKNLTSIDIPSAIDGNTIKAIGSGAFQNCSFITSLTLPDTVTSIEGNAFAGCTGITTLTIPSSVTSIGNGAFSGCSSLTSVALLSTTPPEIGTGAIDPGTPIQVPESAKSAYASEWAAYAADIEGAYTVTFDDRGATTPVNPETKMVIPPATTIDALPTAPEKSGFVFGGWFTEPAGAGDEFTAGTTVTGNITVYAKWNNAYSYTVTFNDHGATTSVNPSSKTVAYPATKIDALPTPPEKTGCLFVGWNTSEDGTGDEFTAGTTVSGNITVHAIWVSCSSVANNRTGAGIGDVVLSNRATVTLSNYSTYASKLTSAGFTPVGVVAYVGKTGVTGGGTPGKTYMVGLDQGNCKWAQEGTTGYLCEMITDLDKGEINWASIQSADSTGAANPAVYYPAFNYCNTYSAAGYTSGWFLPSFRELYRLNDNKTAINDALTAIGGMEAALLDDFVWSSSNISGNTIVEYGFYFNTGSHGSVNKASAGGVRAVRALDD